MDKTFSWASRSKTPPIAAIGLIRRKERSAEAKVPSSIWMRLCGMVPGMTPAEVS